MPAAQYSSVVRIAIGVVIVVVVDATATAEEVHS
jgi:hypothetical protein